MPPAIPDEIRECTIKQWLSGDTRAKIASDNNIGEGSVTNIVSDFNKGLADSKFESIREFAVESRKQGLTLSELGSSLRLYNYIRKLGANQDQIESLITNLANFPGPEKLIEVANRIAQLSRSESIPLENLENHVKQKEEEKQRLEQEIKHNRVILESTNVDVQIISEYKQLKDELSKHRLSIEDPTKLLLVLRTIKQIGYDPQKIVARFSYIKSLSQTEKGLEDNCKMLEERVARCESVLPLAEQISRLRIGIGELLAFHTSVSETAEMNNLSMESAAYRVIEDIQYYNKLGGIKKQLSDLNTKLFVMNQFLAGQNKAVMALFKLQSQGVTENQILYLHNFFQKNSNISS
jgi:CRISPR/Cas system CMR-associated protein Cmr5 small subunit